MGYGHEKGNSVQGSIKGFFFDLDGTLIDTAEANYIAYSEAINNVCGVQVSRQEFRKTNGMVYKDFLALLVPNITDAKIEQISVYKKDAYVKQLDKTTPNTFLLNFLKSNPFFVKISSKLNLSFSICLSVKSLSSKSTFAGFEISTSLGENSTTF